MLYAEHLARNRQAKAAARVEQPAGAPAALSLQERLEAAEALAERRRVQLLNFCEALKEQPTDRKNAIAARWRELEAKHDAPADV